MPTDCPTAKLRLFIALPIPDAVKDEIARAQEELRPELPGKAVRWTKREQFHLTLRFLGNVKAPRLADLSRAVRDACLGVGSLRLRAERVGGFPSLRFPRVLWVWVHDDAEQLVRLQRNLEAAVGDFAEQETGKVFTGHVTIARINGLKRAQAAALAKRAHEFVDRRFGEWTAGEVRLMRSDLLQSGSVHTVLESFALSI